ncbi:MAG: RNA 2',3'-cyclic phosphodiesterase [Pseudomonadota bacterium]
MPRLFTALEVPSTVATSLSFLQSGLPGARWIEQVDMHITLRFIGDVDPPLARELAEAFETVKLPTLELELENLDVFGKSRPHALFAGVKRNDQLFELQSKHERICQRLGLTPESRKYTPHVTIARVRSVSTDNIAKYLSVHGGYVTPQFKLDRFSLFSARDSIGGGPYVKEQTYSLSAWEKLDDTA